MKSIFKNLIRQSFLYKSLTDPIYRGRARWFDLRHNVSTAREVQLDELEIRSANVASGVYYAGTDAKFFSRLLNNWKIPFEDFAFVDLGSGKGRALLLASEQPFKKIIGVEFSQQLSEIAEENIRRYRSQGQKCREIRSICADAADFAFPKMPLVVYMFNPFRREVVAKVLENLEKDLREYPREIYILYANPIHDVIFAESNFFEQVGSDEWHSLHRGVRCGQG